MVKYISYKQLFIYYKSRKNEGVHMEINIGIIAIVVLAIAILAILASGYVKASPNKAYIISGIKSPDRTCRHQDPLPGEKG